MKTHNISTSKLYKVTISEISPQQKLERNSKLKLKLINPQQNFYKDPCKDMRTHTSHKHASAGFIASLPQPIKVVDVVVVVEVLVVGQKCPNPLGLTCFCELSLHDKFSFLGLSYISTQDSYMAEKNQTIQTKSNTKPIKMFKTHWIILFLCVESACQISAS